MVRPGRDVTVVATQLLRKRAIQAAEALAADGIEVEVIDPRTLFPLDVDTIFSSVTKTGRLLVTHEAPELYGFGGGTRLSGHESIMGHVACGPATGMRGSHPYSLRGVIGESGCPRYREACDRASQVG